MKKKQVENIINMAVGGRQHGKTYTKNRSIGAQLLDGQTVWIGTKNRLWFIARFKDDTGLDVELKPFKENSNLYNIKICK